MYRSIYIPIDNSAHALQGVAIGTAIAKQTGATLTGSHVYAAQLHDRRFRQMEGGLPERYLQEAKLQEQREVHDDLISRGLQIVADSYLDVFSRQCAAAGVPCQRVSLEGRNWQKLVDDIRASPHDLVIMGARGLGAVAASLLGSVCERVARRIDRDLLVVKSLAPDPPGAIVAAIDGSAYSYGGLRTALEWGRFFGRPVEAVAVFDPFFHYAAFHRIAGVLSAEAASVFRFQEQEKLHAEIIDSGLARIYQAHLDLAVKVAAEAGVELRTTLLAGKAFEQILQHVRQQGAWLLVVGRLGMHSEGGMDLGSTSENLLRLADCNVLLSTRTYTPAPEQVAASNLAWTAEAAARMERVPPFVRGMAAKTVIRHAVERGHTVVTSDLIDACLDALMAARRDPAATGSPPGETRPAPAAAGRCPFAHLARREKK